MLFHKLSSEELDQMVRHFEDVCMRRKRLKVNAIKSKILVFERNRLSQCNISLNGEVDVVDELYICV